MAVESSRSRRADHRSLVRSCPRRSSSVASPPSRTTGPAASASAKGERAATTDIIRARPAAPSALPQDRPMVFVWGWGPRRRRRGYGPPPGYGYGPPPGYYRRGGGGGSCLRDLLFLETGCCLAELLGCGADALLVAPATLRRVARTRSDGGSVA